MAVAARPASAACDPTPRAGCKLPAVPHKSSLTFFQTGGHDPDDIFTWRWKAGSQTSIADFGNPPATDYSFCIYDSSPRTQPVVADDADTPSDWKALRTDLLPGAWRAPVAPRAPVAAPTGRRT
jgi:hypothetical protein